MCLWFIGGYLLVSEVLEDFDFSEDREMIMKMERNGMFAKRND